MSRRYISDVIMWLLNKRGEYTVKSSYHMARLILKEDNGVGESSRRFEEGLIWQRLWKSKLPNKIKVFG